MNVAKRLEELGITLPAVNAPVANYVGSLREGDLLWVSGHISRRDGKVVTGRVGAEIDTNTAAVLARDVALDILATIDTHVGLDLVQRVIRIGGFVRGVENYGDQSAVLNGASDLFVDVFGLENGRHVRAAIGVSELPANAALEIEGVFRLLQD